MPPPEDKPRISYSVWPGPAVRSEIPGTLPTKSSTVTIFSWARSPALKAVMLIAVACTVDSRFSAVTTISSNPPLFSAGVLPEGAADIVPLRVSAHMSAKIEDERNPLHAPGAHNSCFIDYLPELGENGCAIPIAAEHITPSILIPSRLSAIPRRR